MAGIHGSAMTASRAWSAEEFAGLLADPTVFLIAEQAGFALGRAVVDEAELLTMAVEPSLQRRGTGRRLLDAFEARARALQVGTGFLEVAEDNAAARSLYAAAGWSECGRRRAYYPRAGAPGADALVLRKHFA